jgi:hypothetical protein
VKLRIHANSLRVRLDRSDVEQFRRIGICAGALRFGSGSQLTYTLESSPGLITMEARYRQDCIRVLLPVEMAREWADSDQISVSLNHADDSSPSLLVEKDFQCLHRDGRNPNDDANAFPNPSAGDHYGENVR